MRIGKIVMLGASVFAITTAVAYAADPTPAQKKRTVTSQYYVTEEVKKKQPVIQATTQNGGDHIVVYPNSTGGDPDYDSNGEYNTRHIATSLTGTSTDIPTVGAINAGLNARQAKLSDTAGKVVLYTASEGVAGSANVYKDDSSTYASQTGSLIRTDQVNATVENTFADLLSCREWEANWDETMPGNEDHCVLYSVNRALTGTYVPQPASQQQP